MARGECGDHGRRVQGVVAGELVTEGDRATTQLKPMGELPAVHRWQPDQKLAITRTAQVIEC